MLKYSLWDLLNSQLSTPGAREDFKNTSFRTIEPGNKGVYEEKTFYPSYLQKGIKYDTVYRHQKIVWELLQKQENVVVSLPTAAGKSLCYIPYIVDQALKQHISIVISPLKQLQADQYAEITKFCERIDNTSKVTLSLVNGDTGANSAVARNRRYNAHIIMTNEYSLDHLIKSDALDWSRVTTIVVDEAHDYQNIKGGHLREILQRVRCKVAKAKSNRQDQTQKDLQFVLMSATIANPTELMILLTQKNGVVVDKNYATLGDKEIIISKYTYPEQYLFEVLLGQCGDVGKTIFFIDSVMRTEIYTRKFKEVRHFNSTLKPEDRFALMKDFGEEKFKLLMSTSALQAGVDCPGVSNVVMRIPKSGLSINHAKQRAGRCGRGLNSYGEANEGHVLILLPENSMNPKRFWYQNLAHTLPTVSPDLSEIHLKRFIYEDINKKAALERRPIGITKNSVSLAEKLYPHNDVASLNSYVEYLKHNPEDNSYTQIDSSDLNTHDKTQIYFRWRHEDKVPHRQMLFTPSSNIVIFEDKHGELEKIGSIRATIAYNSYQPKSNVLINGAFYIVTHITQQRILVTKSTSDTLKTRANPYTVRVKPLPQEYINLSPTISISKPCFGTITTSYKLSEHWTNSTHRGNYLSIFDAEGLPYGAINALIRGLEKQFSSYDKMSYYVSDGQILLYETEPYDDSVKRLYLRFLDALQASIYIVEACDCESEEGCTACVSHIKNSQFLPTNKYKANLWLVNLYNKLAKTK